MRAMLLALALMFAALPAMAADRTYTNNADVRYKGMAALVARMGETRPVARLLFTPDKIIATMQADSGRDFAEWTAHRTDLLVANIHSVTGPRRVSAFDLVGDVSGAYFRLSEADLASFERVVRAAIDYAKLESEPVVSSVELSRPVSILPEPAYGGPRWTVMLETADERAMAYVTLAGVVFGGDLSDTKRAEATSFLTGDEWPMAEAQAALGAAIGGAGVHEVRIYEGYVFVTANHPTDSGLARDYSWNLEGVRHGLIDTPNLLTLGMGNRAAFQWSDVDLTALPVIRAAAREAFGAADATLLAIGASKPLDRASGELRVLWEVEFRQANGDEGEVWLDTTGLVVEVKLPESRLPPVGPWLAPETVIDTISRISETFGPDAKLSELLISDTQGSMDIEDPQRPGQLAQFLVDAREITRFGSASYFASLEPGNVFTPGDLAGLSVEQLADMVRRTEERLKMPRGAVFRFTFSRHALIMDPSDNRLMVEIRYGQANGSGDAGWMTFLLDGTQTDELVP